MNRHAGMPAFVLSILLGLGVVPSAHTSPAVIEKNLFSPERRPPSAPEIALTGRGQEQAIVVLGIVAIGSSNPSALIRFKQGRPMNGQTSLKPLLVRTGDQIGDYRVHRIDSGGLILERGGKRYAVPLSREGNVAPVSAGSGHEEAKKEQPKQQDPPAEKPAQ